MFGVIGQQKLQVRTCNLDSFHSHGVCHLWSVEIHREFCEMGSLPVNTGGYACGAKSCEGVGHKERLQITIQEFFSRKQTSRDRKRGSHIDMLV